LWREVQGYGYVKNSPERRYLCLPCKRAFSDRTGTVFAHSNLPLPHLFQAVRIVAQAGETEDLTRKLREALRASPKTAAKWAKRLRKAKEDEFLRRLLTLIS